MTEPTAPVVVESKVTVSTVVALAASIAVAVLNGVQSNPSLLGDLPPTFQAVLLIAVPPVLVFLAGYVTPSNRVAS